MVMTKEEYKKQGKTNRRHGAEFERKVRKDTISKGWIVDKWSNNVDLDTQEIVQAKSNMYGSRSCGFPDFVMFRLTEDFDTETYEDYYKLRFVECKINGKLSKKEKLKMNFLIKQGHKCFVAYKDGKEIIYREFVEYKERN